MNWVKFNLIGMLTFLIITLVGFVTDIINGSGGSAKIFTWFLIAGFILSAIFLIIGTYNILISFFPHLIKIIILLLLVFFTSLQLLFNYIISFILAMYVIAPVMGRMGYYITTP